MNPLHDPTFVRIEIARRIQEAEAWRRADAFRRTPQRSPQLTAARAEMRTLRRSLLNTIGRKPRQLSYGAHDAH